jgi:hypothetical protein
LALLSKRGCGHARRASHSNRFAHSTFVQDLLSTRVSELEAAAAAAKAENKARSNTRKLFCFVFDFPM